MKVNDNNKTLKSVPMNVRVPIELHEELTKEAKRNGRTMSEEVIRRLRNSKNVMAPDVPILVQGIVNYAVSLVKNVYPERCEEIENLGMMVWRYLK